MEATVSRSPPFQSLAPSLPLYSRSFCFFPSSPPSCSSPPSPPSHVLILQLFDSCTCRFLVISFPPSFPCKSLNSLALALVPFGQDFSASPIPAVLHVFPKA